MRLLREVQVGKSVHLYNDPSVTVRASESYAFQPLLNLKYMAPSPPRAVRLLTVPEALEEMALVLFRLALPPACPPARLRPLPYVLSFRGHTPVLPGCRSSVLSLALLSHTCACMCVRARAAIRAAGPDVCAAALGHDADAAATFPERLCGIAACAAGHASRPKPATLTLTPNP